jgi:hypothetical protein
MQEVVTDVRCQMSDVRQDRPGLPHLPSAFLPSAICFSGLRSAGQAWRRPALPPIEGQYPGRCGVSRPSSEWDRVGPPRCDHQAGPAFQRSEVGDQRSERTNSPPSDICRLTSVICLACAWGWVRAARGRAIRTARLHGLPRFHLRPIDVVVFHGSHRDLISRRVSRLDAFSGYPCRT